MDDKHDDRLFEILRETKTISNFLDVIFGFLYRRTDFYHVSNNPKLGIGLEDGLAEKLIMQAFKKYTRNNDVLSQPPAHEEIVTSEDVTVIPDESTKVNQEIKVKSQKSEKQATELDCYNGADCGTYSWSQTITDIVIQIKIPDKLTSKQLEVDISSSALSIRSKLNDTIYLSGQFCRKCKAHETVWSFDGSILQIHLEKSYESWWDCLLQSEPRLDLSKMDCSRPFHELSEEAQAKIEELQWNQDRKRQGLPTSDQLELEKTLKKAWNVEGSPFSGKYDPSSVTLN